jgi:hypothetical protein
MICLSKVICNDQPGNHSGETASPVSTGAAILCIVAANNAGTSYYLGLISLFILGQ